MTGYVVDASVAVQWVVVEEHSRQALTLLDGHTLHAPAHWLAEATNAVLNKSRRGEFDTALAYDRIEVLGAAPVNVAALPSLIKGAFSLSVAHGVSLYDGFYVALAVELGMALVTADVDMLRKLRTGGMGSKHAFWIADLAR